jgi:hypothetical protein
LKRNLLLIEKESNYHYIYIKNLSKLVRNQLTKHEHYHFICDRCFYYTENKEIFRRHLTLCDNYFYNEKAITILPKAKDNILKFKNIYKTMRVPLVYFADLEAVLRKLDHKRLKARHEACAYSFLEVSNFYSNFKKYIGTSAKDTISNFIKTIIDEGKKFNELFLERLKKFEKPQLNNDDLLKFKQSEKCHFCEEFTETNKKVIDHCHINGEFRGAAHQLCNLKVKTSLKIPVFFHNGSGYDFKHFIRKLHKIDKNLKIISQTEEKYISISVKVEETNIQFEFKDSLKFLLKSIDKLAKVLYEKDNAGIENFKNFTSNSNESRLRSMTSSETPNEILELLVQKGVFPYLNLDSFEKLESTDYPNYESFYDNLKDKNIELKEYERGKKLWDYFNCKSFKEYMELYLTYDVLILADCFESFRDLSLKYYGLDPAHYISSPGLSCDAMLKYGIVDDIIGTLTKIELELLTDQDMLFMFMEGIREGLSCIMKRYIEANNKYMINYNPIKETSYLVPVDANNLYGDAMSFKLLYREFEWCTEEELRYLEEHLLEIPDDNGFGYTLKVSLDYPKELHDKHNDYPFFPIHKDTKNENLSSYQNKLRTGARDRSEAQITNVSVARKLVTSLEDKERLICDYRTLKQAVQHGLKLNGIECVIKYEQSAWLKSYIDLNTKLRPEGTSEFEKDFFKLMNNSVYAKTIENVLKRQDIKFCCERKKALRYVKKINFKRETIFTKNLVAVHMNRLQVKYNKPIYVGFCVLEMSKWRMFKFAYEYLKPKWSDNVEVVQTDTDGLMLHIKTEDFYEDIKSDIETWLYTSNFYNNDKFVFKSMNKMELGCFKIETGENIVMMFIGLRAKMYCYTIEHQDRTPEGSLSSAKTELKKREKGVPGHITNKHQFMIWKKVL